MTFVVQNLERQMFGPYFCLVGGGKDDVQLYMTTHMQHVCYVRNICTQVLDAHTHCDLHICTEVQRSFLDRVKWIRYALRFALFFKWPEHLVGFSLCYNHILYHV